MATELDVMSAPADEDERLFRAKVRDTLLGNEKWRASPEPERLDIARRFMDQQLLRRQQARAQVNINIPPDLTPEPIERLPSGMKMQTRVSVSEVDPRTGERREVPAVDPSQFRLEEPAVARVDPRVVAGLPTRQILPVPGRITPQPVGAQPLTTALRTEAIGEQASDEMLQQPEESPLALTEQEMQERWFGLGGLAVSKQMANLDIPPMVRNTGPTFTQAFLRYRAIAADQPGGANLIAWAAAWQESWPQMSEAEKIALVKQTLKHETTANVPPDRMPMGILEDIEAAEPIHGYLALPGESEPRKATEQEAEQIASILGAYPEYFAQPELDAAARIGQHHRGALGEAAREVPYNLSRMANVFGLADRFIPGLREYAGQYQRESVTPLTDEVAGELGRVGAEMVAIGGMARGLKLLGAPVGKALMKVPAIARAAEKAKGLLVKAVHFRQLQERAPVLAEVLAVGAKQAAMGPVIAAPVTALQSLGSGMELDDVALLYGKNAAWFALLNFIYGAGAEAKKYRKLHPIEKGKGHMLTEWSRSAQAAGKAIKAGRVPEGWKVPEGMSAERYAQLLAKDYAGLTAKELGRLQLLHRTGIYSERWFKQAMRAQGLNSVEVQQTWANLGKRLRTRLIAMNKLHGGRWEPPREPTQAVVSAQAEGIPRAPAVKGLPTEPVSARRPPAGAATTRPPAPITAPGVAPAVPTTLTPTITAPPAAVAPSPAAVTAQQPPVQAAPVPTVPVTPPSKARVAAPKPSEAKTGILPTPKAPEAVEGEPGRLLAAEKAIDEGRTVIFRTLKAAKARADEQSQDKEGLFGGVPFVVFQDTFEDGTPRYLILPKRHAGDPPPQGWLYDTSAAPQAKEVVPAPAAKAAEAEKAPEKPPRPPTLLAAEARTRKKISDAGTVLRAQLAEQKKAGKPLREQLKKEEVVSQKAFREGQKDITNLHGALQQFVNKHVTKQGQHRKRLSEAISKARTPTELKIIGERVIATAEAFALGEESVLTDAQLDELKITEQMRGKRKGFRIGKLDTKAKQADLIEFIEEHLPLSERGQLLRTLKNAGMSETTLAKARAAVEAVHARWDKRTAVEDYNEAEKAAKKAVGGPHRNPQVAAPVIDRLATVLNNFVTSKPTQQTLDTLQATVDAEVFDIDLTRDIGYQLAKTKAIKALDSAAKKILVKDMPPGHIRVLTQFIQRTLHEAKRTARYKVQGEARDLQNDVDATLPQMGARGEIKFPGEAVAGVSRERSGLPRVYWDNAIDAHRFFLDYTAIADSVPDRLYKGVLRGMNEQKGWFKLAHEMVIGRLEKEGVHIDKPWILSHRNRSNQAWYRRQVAKVKGPKVQFTDVELPPIKERGVLGQTMRLDASAKSYLAGFFGDPDNVKQVMRKGYKGLSFPADPWTFYPMNSERINAILDVMNGEDLAVLNAVRDFLNGPAREGAQYGFQSVRGHPFVELPNHFARFANRDMGGGKRSDPLEVLRNTKINADGRLSERTGGQSHFIMDIWDVFYSQTTALSRWASLAEPLDSMARFFRVPSIYENNTKRFGPNKQVLLQNYMESVGGVIPYQPTSLPQRAFRFFKGKQVGAALGVNPRVWALQMFSQPLVAWKLDARAAAYGFKAVVKQPNRVNEELDEMVPWAWSRRHLQSGAQIMTPLSARSDSVESLMLGDVEQHFGFKQISKKDRRAIVGVWQSTKERLLRQENQSKLLETDARQWPEDIQEKLVTKFLEVATDTQPTFDIETLSGFQREARRDAFVGSMTAFMSVRTKVTSMYAEEYMRWKTGQITGPEATARVGSLAALFHGTNLVTKWAWRLLLAGLPAALLLRIFGGDEKKYKAWQESQIDDKKTIAGTTTRAVSEVLSTLPGGNVAGALLWQLAKALESRWNRPATVADANIVVDALDDVGRAVDKTVKAVQASGEFERGKHKGEARWKVKTAEAADQWAEAIDGVFVGAGYSGVRQIVRGIKANYDTLGFEESKENITDAYKRYVLDAAKGLTSEEDSKRRTELADRARAVGIDPGTMLSKARKWLKKRENE